MKPISLLYLIRVVLGITAAIICTLYNYFLGFSFTISDLFRGLTITLAFYIVTYYAMKTYFLKKIDKPRKILSTGIGAYLVTWIVIWSLLSTVIVNETSIVFAVDGFDDFEIKTLGDADGSANGLLWANSTGSLSQVQAVKGFLPHGYGGSKSLNDEINIWRDTETLPDALFLRFNVSDVSFSFNTTDGYVVFGIALWLALDETSYDATDSHQLVVRFQNETKYENAKLIGTPDLKYNLTETDYHFNFSITNISNDYTGTIEIDLGTKFKQVFEKYELSSAAVAKLKAVEIYVKTFQGFCSVTISGIQIFLKGLRR